MEIINNFSLKTYNTFGVPATAKQFAAFSRMDELQELLASGNRKIMILGGGSNILFTRNYEGLILKNEIKGIDVIKEDDHHVYVKAGAGESWHRFVQFCIERDLAGVENLSLIPGNIGASPMQNIGAYGVEIKDVFHDLEAFHLEEKKTVTFSALDCAFGYRESIFKNKYRGKFAITQVTFRLNKIPSFNIAYGAIEEELENMKVTLSIQSVSQAVINIRRSKLPDPEKIGNAGSFFKNPLVPAEQYNNLKKEFPLLPGYLQTDGSCKLAAGWLIEQCGWKGYRKGDAGCHSRQALVLVNYGNATGNEVYALSEEILQSVFKKFGVVLEREVNIV